MIKNLLLVTVLLVFLLGCSVTPEEPTMPVVPTAAPELTLPKDHGKRHRRPKNDGGILKTRNDQELNNENAGGL